MFRWFGAVAPPLVAVALLVLPSAAQAAPVTFSTSGAFTAVAPDSGTGTNVLTTGSGATLTYQNVVNSFVDAALLPVSQVSLGTFSFNLNNASGTFAPGDEFTLTITQSDPGGGPESSSAFVTGSIVALSAPSSDSGGVSMVFDGPIIIGQVGYFIDPFTLQWGGNLPGTASGTLYATVAAVPLPAAAWGGMALFGVLGGVKLRRSRQSMMA